MERINFLLQVSFMYLSGALGCCLRIIHMQIVIIPKFVICICEVVVSRNGFVSLFFQALFHFLFPSTRIPLYHPLCCYITAI